MTADSTHPSLLVRLRNTADQAAWREFDTRYGDLIVRYCFTRGLQYSDAQDVRQMVLMSLSRVMPQFRYSPQAWHVSQLSGTGGSPRRDCFS